MDRAHRALWAATAITLAACTSVSAARVPSGTLAGPHLRTIAVIRAHVASAYVLFIPITGHVTLDYVRDRMMDAARRLGADKVVDVKLDITPETGAHVLRELLGWRSADASGVAVVTTP